MGNQDRSGRVGAFSRSWVFLFSILFVVLSIASVAYGVTRNQQLADLTECTNLAINQGISALRERDRIQIEVNESNKRVVASRQRLFNVLINDVREGVTGDALLMSAYETHQQNAAQYINDIDRFNEALRTASNAEIDPCNG